MKIKDHFLSQEYFYLEKTEILGILRTSPRPENLDSYYESVNYISHHQDSNSLRDKLYKFLQQFNLRYKRKILNENLSVNNSTKKKVLDYGCGAGEFLKFIEKDFDTFGFEPNGAARKAAINKLQFTEMLENINQIKDNSLDAITLWHVFEHVDDQAALLNLFYNKLNSNGLLIIAVPNFMSYDAKKYLEYWAAYDVPRHLYHFSITGMKKLMQNNHWQLKKIQPLYLDAFYISMLSEKYKKSPIFWLKGLIFGAISNFKALKTGEFSSLIYVIEKK